MSRELFTVIISTFGDREYWQPYVDRAICSVGAQTLQPVENLYVHGETLAQARNLGAERATGEWLIFLDADDELDSRYVEAMSRGSGDIRRPATLGVSPTGEDDSPVMIPRTRLIDRNFIVIGAAVRRENFLSLGGFAELDALEDWELWLRMVAAGSTIGDVPEAIYRVHRREGSRNADQHLHNRTYAKIRNRYLGQVDQ